MVTPFVIYVPGLVRGKGRPKFARRGAFVKVYSDDKTLSAEAWMKHCAIQAVGQPVLKGPLTLIVSITVAVPASWSKRRRADALLGLIKPTGRPDFDNSVKLICDSLNKIVWQDDSQIVDAHVIKKYGLEPGATLTIDTA